MALAEGTGVNSTWSDWWEEEQRRRELEKKRKEAAEANRPNARGAGQVVPAPLPTTSRPSARGATQVAPVADRKTAWFQERTTAAQRIQYEREQKILSPLQEYYQLANQVGGQDKLAKRVAQAETIWGTYLRPIAGRDVIWQLARSDYDGETLEAMARYGAKYAFSSAFGLDPLVPSSLLDRLGIDRKDDLSQLKAAGDLASGKTHWLTIGGVFPVPFTKSTEEEAWKRDVLIYPTAGLGKLMEVFGRGLSKAIEWGSEGGPAQYLPGYWDLKEKALKEIGNEEGIFNPLWVGEQSTAHETYETWMSFADSLEPADAAALIKDIQKPVFAPDGTLLSPGYASGLDPEDGFTPQAKEAFDRYVKDMMQAAVSTQMAIISMNPAYRDLPLNGDLYGEEWQEPLAWYQSVNADQTEAAYQNPDAFHALQMVGWPSVTGGWGAWFSRLTEHGYLSAVPGAAMRGVKTLMGSIGAAQFLATVASKKANDPTYTRLSTELHDYVNERKLALEQDGLQVRAESKLFAAQFMAEDKKAQEMLLKLNAREAQIVTDTPSGSWLAIVGHGVMHKDYGKMERFLKENTDLVAGTDFLAEILAAGGYGFAKGILFRAPARSLVGAEARVVGRALEDTAALIQENSAAALVRASTNLGGTEGAAVAGRIHNILNATKSTDSSTFYKSMGEDLKDAIKAGDRDAIASQLPELVDVDSFLAKAQKAMEPKAPKEVPGPKKPPNSKKYNYSLGYARSYFSKAQKAGYSTEQAKSLVKDKYNLGSFKEATNDMIQDVYGQVISGGSKLSDAEALGTFLEKWQRKNKDLLPQSFVRDSLTQAYAEGAAILPTLAVRGTPSLTSLAYRLDQWVEPTFLYNRQLWRTLTGGVHRAPISQVPLWTQQTIGRLYDYAYHVSRGDVQYANRVAARYVKAASSENNAAISTIQESLLAMERKNFRVTKMPPEVNRALGVSPKTGEPLGDYLKSGKIVSPPPDVPYSSYTLRLGRENVMRAPLRLENLSGLEKYLGVAENASRAVQRSVLHPWNVKLRRLTVAARPQLFFKHIITDPLRNISTAPLTVLRFHHYTSDFEKALTELAPETVQSIRFSAERMHFGEQQWLYGGKGRDFSARRVWDGKEGQLAAKDKDLLFAARAYRRMSGGPGFKAWSQAGEDGVRVWVASKEGWRFLNEKGHVDRVKIDLEAANRKVDAETFRTMVADDYIERYVRGLYEPLEAMAPKTMAKTKAISTGTETLSEKELADTIRLAGPSENPILDMEFETNPGRTSDFGQRMVGYYLTGNKLSRDQLYRYTFMKVYNKAKRDGLDPDKAAGIARDAAELKVPQTHFDLSNALMVEQKYRWFSWFATKQRLYTTWLAKWAVRNPFQVAAVGELIDWLGERNDKNPDIPEWRRHDINLSFKGIPVSIPLGLLTWTAHDYPMETTSGQLVKFAASVPLAAATRDASNLYDINAATEPFGPSTGPWDQLALTLATIAWNKPIRDAVFDPESVSEEDLEKQINSMSAKDQRRWDEAIQLERIIALHEGEGEISSQEALHRAAMKAILDAAWNSFRPVPLRITGKERDTKYEMGKKLDHYLALPPEKRPAYLEKNEDLRIFFGLHDNPIEQANMQDASERFFALRDQFIFRVKEATKSGAIYEQKTWTEMKREYEIAIDDLRREDPWFDKWAALNPTISDTDLKDKLGIVYPLMDTASWWEQNRNRTTDEISAFKAERVAELNDFVAGYGADAGDRGGNPASTSDPLYQITRYFMVEKPLQEYARVDPETGQPYKEDAIAYYLAKGGRTGVWLADEYRRTVESQHKVSIMLKGNNKGRANPNKPMFVYLSPEDKDAVFWNAKPSTMETWFEWAKGQAFIKNDMLNRQVKTTTKAGKAEYGKRMAELQATLAEQDPDWQEEYNFSTLPLHQKLRELGVGSGNTEKDEGWRDFLDIVEAARDGLAAENVVTFDGKKAKPIAEWFSNQVLQLKRKNAPWWMSFSLHMDVRDFGLGGWHFPGDAELYPENYDRIDYGEVY